MHRISDVGIDTRRRKTQLHARLPVAADTRCSGSLDLPGLPRDFLALILENMGHCRGQFFLGRGKVDSRRKAQGNLAPTEADAVHLLEQSARYLKYDRMGKGDDASRRPRQALAAKLHEMHSDQPQVDDFTRHLADLHSVADADPVLSDQKEI